MDIITTTEDLKAHIKTLQKERFITIDTEFLRDKTYYSKLCLVQLGGKNGAVAVDPLARGMDLTPLKALLKDKKVIKVFHSADQDIEIIYRMFGLMPKPIFDTQIAAQVMGYGDSVGYANLVRAICHKALDKSSQFTDWARRPLSNKQLKYALDDVIYLREIYLSLAEDLKAAKREKWITEDLEELVNPRKYKNDPEHAWKRLKLRKGSPEFFGVVKALAAYREEMAQKKDVPRNRIMRDEALLEIAASAPTKVGELRVLRRVHNKTISDYGDDIIKMIRKGKKNPVKNNYKPKLRTEENKALIDLLRVVLKWQCEKHRVAQKLIASADDLVVIASSSETALRKSDLPAMHGWRYEVFGKQALRLKRGEVSVTVQGNVIELIAQ